MHISLSHNLVFLAPQKTGTRSIYEIMEKHYDGKIYNEHWHVVPEQVKHFTTFVTARNPYDRIISLWWSMCKREGDRYGYKEIMTSKGLENDPVSFLKSLKQFESRTQADYHKQNKIDHIIHTENLEEEFKKLPFYNKNIVFPHNNTTFDVRPPTEEFLTDEFVELVNIKYHEDFELLGYNKVGRIT